MNELQFGSAIVASLPSVLPFRIAVTGRQELYVYFASQAQIAASARVILWRANRRAFCASVLSRCPATIRAIEFQWPGGVSVPAPSAQNNAICDCSAVRADPTAAPSAFTSL